MERFNPGTSYKCSDQLRSWICIDLAALRYSSSTTAEGLPRYSGTITDNTFNEVSTMHLRLRRLSLVNEDSLPPEKVESVDHDSPPKFFSSTKPIEDTTMVTRPDGGRSSRSNGGQGAVVAIAVCFTLLTLMVVCKNRARRGSLHSGQRSIHHRGNKKKVAPLPLPPVEPPVGGEDGSTESNNNVVDDEEASQVHVEDEI